MLNANGGTASKRYILEATGSGVAIFDYDNDGWPDIFLVNGDLLPAQDQKDGKAAPPTSHLFHNNHDGTFTDVTAHAGLTDTAWGLSLIHICSMEWPGKQREPVQPQG